MPQFPLCSEFIPLLDTVKNQLAGLKDLSQEFLRFGDDATKQKALMKSQELEKTKQRLVELKEQPTDFEGHQIPRIEKELLVFFRNKLSDDLKYEVSKGIVSKINVSNSNKPAVVLAECWQYLKLFGDLQRLDCRNTQLTALPEILPVGLQRLDCSNTQLTALPETLPVGLQELSCSHTQLTALPETLPDSLQRLYCYNTQLTALPKTLPVGLQELDCSYTQLTALPKTLPDSLQRLDCHNTQLTALPETLPDSLQRLSCSNTQLTALPETLPVGLQELYCSGTPAAKNPATRKQLEEFKENHPSFRYIKRA